MPAKRVICQGSSHGVVRRRVRVALDASRVRTVRPHVNFRTHHLTTCVLLLSSLKTTDSPCGEPAAVCFSTYVVYTSPTWVSRLAVTSVSSLFSNFVFTGRALIRERMYKRMTSPSAQTTQPTVVSEQHIKPACTFTQVTQQLFTNPTAPLPDLAQLRYWGFSSRKDYFDYLRCEEFGGEPATKPSDDPDGTLAKLVAQLGVPRRQRK
ncbi:uncharacterized protein EV422DRAFT_528050 [Fimicolochytrium jonesii]|uniref:uncharacterized protein n=1 Tax=Fimicolochytrium jonesii TaxID=1396493 RepID=UPI0022FEF479|nr:uncharacterized protein EV422DRAFT_528050 [Fimicolochytrium jonesii]KAI8821407.1 hypothetical protein EV422DRAFT_528050 [Fimicolochytrium jonesii]